MAITINGSGTIGGVSVGGLPDGIVDTDMLASAAVTSAKVGTLGTSNLPAGSVLQVVRSGQFNNVTTSSTSFQYSSTTPSITPTYSSSKIFLLWSTSIINDVDNDSQGSNNSIVTFEYQIGGTGGSWTEIENFNVPGRGGNHVLNHASQLLSPSTTSIVYFRVGIKKGDGSRSILINSSWGSNVLTMMEIAG
jgi:hypothetical protein